MQTGPTVTSDGLNASLLTRTSAGVIFESTRGARRNIELHSMSRFIDSLRLGEQLIFSRRSQQNLDFVRLACFRRTRGEKKFFRGEKSPIFMSVSTDGSALLWSKKIERYSRSVCGMTNRIWLISFEWSF